MNLDLIMGVHNVGEGHQGKGQCFIRGEWKTNNYTLRPPWRDQTT